MGINKESDIVADLQIGPTTEGNVRIYISGKNLSIPLDFSPDEAEDIASELIESAKAAKKSKKFK